MTTMLFVMLDKVGRELRRYQGTGACDATQLTPLVDLLEGRGGETSWRTSHRLTEALRGSNFAPEEDGAAVNTMYLTARAIVDGRQPDPRNLESICDIIERWGNIQRLLA